VDASLIFDEGSVRGYPFDSHEGVFDISARLESDRNVLIPIKVNFNQATPGFNLNQFAMNAGTMADVFVFFTIKRSLTTIMFSLFVITLSWALSLIIGYLALQVLKNKRPVEPPMIASPCALLFALPSLVRSSDFFREEADGSV
jgi:hypothetical protein